MTIYPLWSAVPALILGLTGCNMAMEPPNQSDLPGTRSAATVADGSPPLTSVYVARQGPGDLTGMKARFEGAWGLRGACLVFEGSGQVYLPVLGRSTPVTVFANRAEISGRAHRFQTRAIIVGGAADASAAAMLDSKPPTGCAWPLLRVNGIQ